jgi:hypothetical protein
MARRGAAGREGEAGVGGEAKGRGGAGGGLLQGALRRKVGGRVGGDQRRVGQGSTMQEQLGEMARR